MGGNSFKLMPEYGKLRTTDDLSDFKENKGKVFESKEDLILVDLADKLSYPKKNMQYDRPH